MKISVRFPARDASPAETNSEIVDGAEWEFLGIPTDGATNNSAINDALETSRSDFYIFASSRDILKSVDKQALTDWLKSGVEFDLAYGNSRDGSREGRVLERPAPSPERLRCQNYLGEVIILSAAYFNRIGGFEAGSEGAEIYALVLKSVREAAHIVQIIKPFYSSPNGHGKSTDWSLFETVNLQRVRDVLSNHLSLTGGGQVLSVAEDGVHDTRRNIEGSPLVSIVIPTRARADLDGTSYLIQTLESVTSLSTYTNYEIVLVIDEGADAGVMTRVRAICEKLKLLEVTWSHPFNFSDKVNIGAVSSHGDFILLLNDDVQVISPHWIESMLALAQRPNAGISGAMLYFEDETIQHAGHAYKDGEASHVGLDEPRSSEGPLRGYRVEREIAGVTAACSMIPRQVFYDVGGFTGLLPGAFNDVDFSLKVSSRGYDIYWTPHAELYHFESKSRDASVRQFEVEILRRRWGHKLLLDPYWPYSFTRPVA